MSGMDSGGTTLSAAGLRRRAEILRVLESAQRVRRVRAIGARAASAGLVLVVAVVVVRVWQHPVPAPVPHVPPIARAHRPAGPMIEIVGNVPGIVERVTVPDAEMPRVTLIDDEQLAGELASAGLASGYIRSGDRFRLASDVGRARAPGG